MDDGELIERVSEFSVIYDKKHPHFKNKIFKENAWKTIAVLLSVEDRKYFRRKNMLYNNIPPPFTCCFFFQQNYVNKDGWFFETNMQN